jgi:peptidoglycan hydrolase-like protein with peptidoglycan-binding domain
VSDNRQHIVEAGDCMASIAALYGYRWETLWDLPENKPLKDKRQNPFTLLPGDNVSLPPAAPRFKDCATGKKHRFVLKVSPVDIHLILLDEDEKPFANQPYALDVDGRKFNGSTDGKGALKHRIPGGSRKGHLVVGSGNTKREYYLQLGYVHPIDTISGGQARLYDGPVDGELNGHTRSAILVFQKKHKLPMTGEYDKATQDKLKERFGC